MPSVKHKKVSAKADSSDDQLIRPSEWNDDHNISTLTASVWLGQNATGPGPVKELPVESASGDDFTMMTKDAITAAISTAVANLKPFATGDLAASIAATKTGGWVLCNGQTLNKANGTSNHDLFVMLWAINGATWPVAPSRGTSAEGDWNSNKFIAVPDARGCVLGMLGTGTSVNNLIAQLGVRVGVDKGSLTVANLPAHDHGWIPREGSSTPSTSAGTVRGGTWADPSVANADNKGTARSEMTGSGTPVSVVQPTMGVNIFIKL